MDSREPSAQQSRALVAQLKRSQIFRDYEQAFRDTTGLPIALRPIEAFDLPHHGDPKENPFSRLDTAAPRPRNAEEQKTSSLAGM